MATDFTTPGFPAVQPQDLIEVISQAADAVLESIAQSQELLLAAAKQSAASLPKVPEVTIPFPGAPEMKVPSAQELVDVSFAFAHKWLASQESFTQKYLALANA